MKKLQDLHDLIYKFVKNAMAYSRHEFVNFIEHVIIGAAGEFYKCRLNDKLGINHPDRSHWEKEWRYHLDVKLTQVITHKATFKDKRKAIEQAIQESKDVNSSCMTTAANKMARYLNQSPIKFQKILTDKDTDDFFKEVNAYIDTIDLSE